MRDAPYFETGAVVLGAVGNVASWRRPNPAQPDSKRWGPMLIIQTCSTTDDVAHTPAESVTLTTRDAMLALRSAIDEALRTE